MFKPTGNLVFVRSIENNDGHLILPDNVDPVKGDVFEVVDVGIGVYDSGVLIKPEVKIGDRVCVAGGMLKLPMRDKLIYIARHDDIIAYEREKVE